MPDNNQRASLRDVLNYNPDQYLSDEEVALIRSTFANNPKLIAVIRKVFLPTVADPSLPIEEIANDAFMANMDFGQMAADEIKPIVMGRQDAIRFVIGGLVKLKVIAHGKEESPYAEALRRKKDSSK